MNSPRRQPSPGRAIGSRSHAYRLTPTSIDSKQAVLCSWWQDPALWMCDSRLSPDGRRLAFASARADGKSMDIWIAEADGSNPQQLTHGPGISQGSPSWSPDGRRLAFDAEGKDSRSHVWMIDADGGTPRQLTADTGDQVVPTWSQDGRWIYYSWWQADTRDIWRMPANGGVPERLTHGAGGALRVRVGRRQEPVVPTEGRRFAVDDNGAGGRASAATDSVREEQRVWRWPPGRVLRALRSGPRPTAVCARSEDRSKRAARQIGRTLSRAPWGSVCRPTATQSSTRGRCSHAPT